MSSFYGGKQGRTYHIVKRYDSVEQMVEAFSKGGAYSEVNYGQYVIIDTIPSKGRSNIQNGLLYRRGFDYNEGYNNQPDPTESQFQDVETGFNKQLFQQTWQAWAQHPGGGAIYVGQIVGPEGRSPQIQILKWSTLSSSYNTRNKIEIDSTPGKIDNNTFNDVIKAGYVNIQDSKGDIVGGKIAFDIPYTVFDVAVTDNAYDPSTVVENPSSTAHPFYYKWDFNIPRGKKGDSLEEIKIENGSQVQQEFDGFGNPIVEEDSYFTFNTRNYEERAEGNLIQHQGRWPYRVINEINPIKKIRNNILFWEDGDTSNKEVQIGSLYREDNYPENVYLVCISNEGLGVIGKNQIPSIDKLNNFTLGTEVVINNTIWKLVKISEEPPVNYLNIDYKAGLSSTAGLHNLDYLTVDNKGKMYAIYSDSDIPYYLTTVKSIEKIDYENRGDITQTQSISISYKDGSKNDEIAGRLNSIIAVEREGDNLLLLYSDPETRANISQDRKRIKNWKDPITGREYTNLIWYKFGPLGAQYHVQGEYQLDDLKENGILYNGFTEPFEDRAGWLVTISEEKNGLKIPHIYAYDYNDDQNNPSHELYDGTPSNWYQIMSLSESVIKPDRTVVISDVINPDSNSVFTNPSDLNEGGVWFVVSYGHDED